MQIVFQHYVISNSERYFKKPDQFEPERWLKSNKQDHHPFASLPFGYGKRMCLGRRFAELEIQTLILKVSYESVNLFVFITTYHPQKEGSVWRTRRSSFFTKNDESIVGTKEMIMITRYSNLK